MWSRLIGLVLIGTIMLANMRAVLWSVSRVGAFCYKLDALRADRSAGFADLQSYLDGREHVLHAALSRSAHGE